MEDTTDSDLDLGFAFGNINEDGAVDVDYLDEDAKKHLKALSSLLGDHREVLVQGLQKEDAADGGAAAPVQRAANAIDFENETEEADDYDTKPDASAPLPVLAGALPGSVRAISAVEAYMEDDYDAPDDAVPKLAPAPHQVPAAAATQPAAHAAAPAPMAAGAVRDDDLAAAFDEEFDAVAAAADAAGPSAAAPGQDLGQALPPSIDPELAMRIAEHRAHLAARQDELGIQVLAMLPTGERLIRHTALGEAFELARYVRYLSGDPVGGAGSGVPGAESAAETRQRQLRAAETHAARVADQEAHVQAAAVGTDPDTALDLDLDRQRLALQEGALPQTLVDDLALMRPAAGLQLQQWQQQQQQLQAVTLDALASGAPLDAEAQHELAEHEAADEEAAAEAEAAAASARLGCGVAHCKLHALEAQAQPLHRRSGAAQGALDAPLAVAAAQVLGVMPVESADEEDEDAVVPQRQADALAEALMTALRVERSKTREGWVHPSADMDDRVLLDEVEELLAGGGRPSMIGFVPEALAAQVFNSDWEQDIIWEPKEPHGSEAVAGEARAAGSPMPAEPAAAAVAAGEAEQEDGVKEHGKHHRKGRPGAQQQQGGPSAMDVDGPAKASSGKPSVIIANPPLNYSTVWRHSGPRAAGWPKGHAPGPVGVDGMPLPPPAQVEPAAAGQVGEASGGVAAPLALLGAGTGPSAWPKPWDADPDKRQQLRQQHDQQQQQQRLFINGLHPQALRLLPAPAAAQAQAADASGASGFARSTTRYFHPSLAQEQPWVEAAVEQSALAAGQGPSAAAAAPPPLILNMNDPGMVFRARLPEGGQAKQVGLDQLRRGPALVAPPLQRKKVERGPIMEAAQNDRLGKQLAAFNVSLDGHYTHQAKTRTDRTQKSLSKHANPALTLTTLPARLTHPELMSIHRPRNSSWCLATAVQRAAANPGAKPPTNGETLYMFRSITGQVGPKAYANSKMELLSDILSIKDEQGRSTLDTWYPLHTSMPYSMWAGTPPAPPVRLTPEARLASVGLTNPLNNLYLLAPGVKPLPRPFMPGPGGATKPPAAFQTKQQLTATQGHILLLEYLEEHPPLLARPAMGVRLLTFYQRRDDADLGHNNLLPPGAGADAGGAGGRSGGGAGGRGGQVWKLGTVMPLGPENSPFYCQLQPGQTVLCVDTHMFKAPAVPHDPRPSDFLLVRATNTGAMMLREVTGCLTVGQQFPFETVPAPWNSSWLTSYSTNRVFVAVARRLAIKQKELQKKGIAAKPSITLAELSQQLPFIPKEELRVRLERECGCRVKVREGQDPAEAAAADNPTYELPDGIPVTEESKLRELLRPDVVCAYESMRAAEVRLKALGLQHLEALTQVARNDPERWQTAVRQLAELDPSAGAALRLIDWVINTAPWATTQAYVSATKGDMRASTWLKVEAPYDPTGRGNGLCFLADVQRAAKPELAKQQPQEGSITGTEADLRKLGHEEAGRMLKQWGVKEDVVNSMTNRWRRIDLVRKLNTQAAIDGTEGFNAHFVRVQKNSIADQQASARRQASVLLQKQLAVLAADREWGAAPEDYGLLKPLGHKAGAAATTSAATEDETELRAYMDLQSGGFFGGGEGAGGKEGKGKGKAAIQHEARPKERRLRRVVEVRGPDGGVASRKELVYRDKQDIMLLNRAVNRSEIGGYGQVVMQPAGDNFLKGAQGAALRVPAVRGATRGAPRGTPQGRGTGGGPKRRRGGGRAGHTDDEEELDATETETESEEDEEAKALRNIGTARRAGARQVKAAAEAEDGAAHGEPGAEGGGGEPAAPPSEPKPKKERPKGPPRPRKPAAPRAPQLPGVCPECGQPGHGAYSKACPNFTAKIDLSGSATEEDAPPKISRRKGRRIDDDDFMAVDEADSDDEPMPSSGHKRGGGGRGARASKRGAGPGSAPGHATQRHSARARRGPRFGDEYEFVDDDEHEASGSDGLGLSDGDEEDLDADDGSDGDGAPSRGRAPRGAMAAGRGRGSGRRLMPARPVASAHAVTPPPPPAPAPHVLPTAPSQGGSVATGGVPLKLKLRLGGAAAGAAAPSATLTATLPHDSEATASANPSPAPKRQRLASTAATPAVAAAIAAVTASQGMAPSPLRPPSTHGGGAAADAPVQQLMPVEEAESIMCEAYADILAAIKKDKLYNIWFGHAVNLKVAPDYHAFVPEENVVILPTIERRVPKLVKGEWRGKLQYSHYSHLRADFERILANATAYNSPGCGTQAAPTAIQLAENLLALVDERLAAWKPRLDQALLSVMATDHWMECAKCKKWRPMSYPQFVALRGEKVFACDKLPGKTCSQVCDYCRKEPCTC